ncbi:hypothetical protein [Sphingobacterium endophyticum]
MIWQSGDQKRKTAAEIPLPQLREQVCAGTPAIGRMAGGNGL